MSVARPLTETVTSMETDPSIRLLLASGENGGFSHAEHDGILKDFPESL
jgi:hypothetical protein